MKEDIKLTKRQKEIVKLMREGWILLCGISDYSGRNYYCVSKGFDNIYFNATVFSNLLTKRIIYQESRNFDYVLTDKGETVKI